jgi:hypothetical protein
MWFCTTLENTFFPYLGASGYGAFASTDTDMISPGTRRTCLSGPRTQRNFGLLSRGRAFLQLTSPKRLILVRIDLVDKLFSTWL